ncbi:MAG: Rho termination factor N-terminal domain-containing protein [Lachnospiraceae bacterium]|nr:Rho termination factor N-terminal domain-containing protein [Lachnospiraceae bacterium]
MNIKIKKGIFGWKKNGIVKAITPQHGPIEVEDELAQSLIDREIAEKVEEPTEDPEEEPADTLENKTVGELKKMAEEKGIDTKKLKKKQDLIEALEDAKESEEEIAEDDADDDELPELAAEEPQ